MEDIFLSESNSHSSLLGKEDCFEHGTFSVYNKNPIAWAQRRALDAKERAERLLSAKPIQLFLPGFRIGTMPNHLNRSSIFAPIARGRRQYHRQAMMVTRSDVIIKYTGEQLDEADADLIMALIFAARNERLGDPVILNRAALLRSIGRNTGKHDYEWLHRRMKAFTEGTLFIEARKPDGSPKYSIGFTQAFHILSSFEYNYEAEAYGFILDPRWQKLFGNREYSRIDWEKRLKIKRGQDMAKTLQRLISTSSDGVQRYTLDWLKEKMQYTSPKRKFKKAIEAASHELIGVEIISMAKVGINTKGREQLTIWKHDRDSIPV